MLCQQRKVKCNRAFPCSNCVRSQAQCVPTSALAPRQRRRRFPERELLDRLRRYESLLRQHKVSFEPLHRDPSSIEEESGPAEVSGDEHSHGEEQPGVARSGGRSSSPSTTTKSETVYNAKYATISKKHCLHMTNILCSETFGMSWIKWYGYIRSCAQAPLIANQKSRDVDGESDDSLPKDVGASVIQRAWLQKHLSDDHLLFGSRLAAIDLATLHPEQLQIFQLWQIYLDNVNPLLKVTHTPTMQARIIDAASDVASIEPSLAALMFSIYCMSVLSLTEAECYAMFNLSKKDLMKRYQFGCQQALLSAGFLRSSDRHCLTALFLYLVSRLGGQLYLYLILVDLGPTGYRSCVAVLYAEPCDPHCAAHGHS